MSKLPLQLRPSAALEDAPTAAALQLLVPATTLGLEETPVVMTILTTLRDTKKYRAGGRIDAG